MPFSATHRVTIRGEAEDSGGDGLVNAVVEIEFDEVEQGKDYVGAVVRLRIPNYPWVGVSENGFQEGAFYYGRELFTFVEGLERLRAELRGSARLIDWDLEPVLCLTVVDPVSGKIAIGGHLLPALFCGENHSEADFLSPRPFGGVGGIRVTFEGIITDQSYLISAISELRRFLVETGIPNTGG